MMRKLAASVAVIAVAGTVALLMPDRQPTEHPASCANGNTPITWVTVDNDGATLTNVRCDQP